MPTSRPLQRLLLALALVAVTLVGYGAWRLFNVPEHLWLATWSARYPEATGWPPTAVEWPDPAALAAAAARRAAEPVTYDPAYVQIAFPGGDVPASTGVCTDLVVRALRDVGLDLQLAVNTDMAAARDAYPTIWGRRPPDPNIDHRRVPNLVTYFARQGLAVPIADAAYLPGDLVAWHLGRGVTHIGIVVAGDDGTPRIAHHIAGQPAIEDVIDAWPIIAHLRLPPHD